ncbi:MAG: biotin-dependent carboxyltransferase family protein [Rhodospirillales bacterium]|nr:biotin-dependent carboxyltransferase family protein [Rhodospirillales bacterium]
MLEVIDGGLRTTVQDMGRRGGQALGIPPSGAQDGFALRVANLLVGNAPGGPLLIRDDPGAAGLELTLGRLKLRALQDHVLALTGADTGATVDGEAVPCWTSFVLREGQTLACGLARSGARAYLAIHGGIDVPLYRGSRATHVSGGFGGLEGRPLAKDDRLPVGAATAEVAELAGRRLRPDLVPAYAPPMQVRTVAGPEEHHFTAASVEAFYATAWKLNPKADRTGMRFIGPELSFKPGRPRYLIEDAGADPSNIVIDPGAPVGTVQVPSGVEPIVLCVDSPSIGGYARIAIVISTDMARIGQVRPFEETRFVRISHEDAVAVLAAQEALIADPDIII